MIDETTLEKRLTALEEAVADLRQRVAAEPTNANWLDKFIGSITDIEAFDKAMEYGRAYRYADRPTEELGDKT